MWEQINSTEKNSNIILIKSDKVLQKEITMVSFPQNYIVLYIHCSIKTFLIPLSFF